MGHSGECDVEFPGKCLSGVHRIWQSGLVDGKKVTGPRPAVTFSLSGEGRKAYSPAQKLFNEPKRHRFPSIEGTWSKTGISNPGLSRPFV